VQIVQSLRQISAKFLDGFFRQLSVLLDELEEITSSTVLKNDPKMISGFVPVIELQDMPILETMEDPDFIEYLFSSILFN
jgi:hypothetical protein